MFKNKKRPLGELFFHQIFRHLAWPDPDPTLSAARPFGSAELTGSIIPSKSILLLYIAHRFLTAGKIVPLYLKIYQ